MKTDGRHHHDDDDDGDGDGDDDDDDKQTSTRHRDATAILGTTETLGSLAFHQRRRRR